MSDTLSCSLCGRDPDTGEYFCPRFGGWQEKCPKQDEDAERVGDGEEDSPCA